MKRSLSHIERTTSTPTPSVDGSKGVLATLRKISESIIKELAYALIWKPPAKLTHFHTKSGHIKWADRASKEFWGFMSTADFHLAKAQINTYIDQKFGDIKFGSFKKEDLIKVDDTPPLKPMIKIASCLKDEEVQRIVSQFEADGFTLKQVLVPGLLYYSFGVGHIPPGLPSNLPSATPDDHDLPSGLTVEL